MEFTTGGRLEVRITPADVGKRVSVRRLTGASDGTEKFTDTVGVLTSWDDDVVLITRRTGETVRIAESSLVAGKVVPAAPARRRGPATSFRELARVAARAWPPVEREALGGWELRASAGFTRRANSVLPLGEPGMPLDEALGHVRRWYGHRGLPAYIQAATGAEGTQELLCAELEARGWRREVTAGLRVGALAPLADAGPDDTRVRLDRTCDEAWLRRYQRFEEPGPVAWIRPDQGAGSGAVDRKAEERGMAEPWRPTTTRQGAAPGHASPAGSKRQAPGPAVLRVLGGGPSVWFASVAGDDDGVPAAIGRCVVDGRWAGFMAVEVDPARRRRGLAGAVMRALAGRALEEGASAAWLQVESDNEAAGALYDGLGFTTHHLYHHFRAA